MAFKIIITEPALADLEQVMNWSLERYQATSERFGTALINHIELLKAFPFLGAPVKDLPGVTRLIHSPLHIYNRVRAGKETIEILHYLARRTPVAHSLNCPLCWVAQPGRSLTGTFHSNLLGILRYALADSHTRRALISLLISIGASI